MYNPVLSEDLKNKVNSEIVKALAVSPRGDIFTAKINNISSIAEIFYLHSIFKYHFNKTYILEKYLETQGDFRINFEEWEFLFKVLKFSQVRLRDAFIRHLFLTQEEFISNREFFNPYYGTLLRRNPELKDNGIKLLREIEDVKYNLKIEKLNRNYRILTAFKEYSDQEILEYEKAFNWTKILYDSEKVVEFSKRNCFLEILEKYIFSAKDLNSLSDFSEKSILAYMQSFSSNKNILEEINYPIRKLDGFLKAFAPIEKNIEDFVPWIGKFLKANAKKFIVESFHTGLTENTNIWRYLIENQIPIKDFYFYRFYGGNSYEYLSFDNLKEPITDLFTSRNIFLSQSSISDIISRKIFIDYFKEKYNKIINDKEYFEKAKEILKSSQFAEFLQSTKNNSIFLSTEYPDRESLKKRFHFEKEIINPNNNKKFYIYINDNNVVNYLYNLISYQLQKEN